MNNNIKLILKWIFVIAWMVVIFAFSSRNADESSTQSHWVGKTLGSIVISDFEDWPEEEQEAFAEKWDYPVRKTAHMTEYAILGGLIWLLLTEYQFKIKKFSATAFAISVCYAATDEFHQLFVPGRACKITDVGFDSIGALAGILLCMGICKLLRAKNAKI